MGIDCSPCMPLDTMRQHSVIMDSEREGDMTNKDELAIRSMSSAAR